MNTDGMTLIEEKSVFNHGLTQINTDVEVLFQSIQQVRFFMIRVLGLISVYPCSSVVDESFKIFYNQYSPVFIRV